MAYPLPLIRQLEQENNMRDVCTPSDESEAEAIASLLRKHDIDVIVLSYHDTAFDGIYQAGKGWGRIRVPGRDADRAKALVREWRSARPM